MLELDLSLQQGPFTLRAALQLPSSGVTALFGPNGAGKSTLAHAIAGLKPANGRIVLDGETLLDTAHGVNVPAEHRRIGCVFQDARLFPHLTVDGNLEFARRRARGAPYVFRADVIALLALAPLLQRRPHDLSGGERQRVALARALLSQPRLLILDEPLSAMDQARRDEVLPYIESLKDRFRVPMLYVSHQYDEVLRLASHGVVMHHGQVAASADIPALSLSGALQSALSAAAVGAVIDAPVTAVDAAEGLATVQVGGHPLFLPAAGATVGQRLRLLLPANEVILSTQAPVGLSVRNALPGRLESLTPQANGLMMAVVEVGGEHVLARITAALSRRPRSPSGRGAA